MSSSTANRPYSTAHNTNFISYYRVLNLQPQWDIEKLRSALKKALAESQGRINAAKGDKREELELRIKWIGSARKIFSDLESKAK
jgi:DnaJ-domain-containing protein 1